MAIGLRLKFDGGTQGQNEAIHSHMGVEDDPPDGLIFHSAGPIAAPPDIREFPVHNITKP